MLHVPCSLCSHEQRKAIEAACSAGRPVARVAELFSVSALALKKHASHTPHVVAKRTKRTEAKASVAPTKTRPRAASPTPTSDDDDAPETSRSPVSAATARANAHRIATTIDVLLADAGKDKDASYQDKAALARAALSANRQLAQLTGEWGASESTVASSPHFKRLLNVILEALRGDVFGEARRAVIDALAREERGGKTEQAAA